MSKEPNNIDRLIKEKLEGFEMAPPANSWGATASALSSVSKKRFFLFLFMGISALVIFGAGVYFYSLSDTPIEQITAKNFENQNPTSISNTFTSPRTSNNKDQSVKLTSTHNRNAEKTIEGSNNERAFSGTNVSMDRENSDDLITHSSNNRANKRHSSSDQLSSKSTAIQQLGNVSENDLPVITEFATSSGSNKRNDQPSQSSILSKHQAVDQVKPETSSNAFISRQLNTSSSQAQVETDMSLTIRPVQLFKSKKALAVSKQVEKSVSFKKSPFWKSFSVEGGVGVSTFRNQAANKLISPNLLSTLNNAASNERSLDFRLGVNYHFTDRFSFQTGIHHNILKETYTLNSSKTTAYTYVDTTSFTVDSVTLDTTFVIDTLYGDSISVIANSTQNSYRIFTLPFQFSWTQPISPRSALEFSLGGAISIFGNNTGSVIADSSYVNGFLVQAKEGYRTTGMLSLGGSLKYLYRFGNHHAAYVEPWIQFGVTNQSRPALNYESFRKRYGVRLGYRFYF